MKIKLLLLPMALLSVSWATSAAVSPIVIGDEKMVPDTIFHAVVGPGTTQTSLHFEGENPLDVFYLTIDKRTPGVSLRSIVGEKLAGRIKTSIMAETCSNDSVQYFAGVNGDFFEVAGFASDSSSIVGTPIAASIVDGEVFKTSHDDCQFTIDASGVARICRLNFNAGMARCGEYTAEFHAINEMSQDNSLTLYTPRFFGSTNQAEYSDSCAEVSCRLLEGEKFVAGTLFRVEVTSDPTFGGDSPIPDDGYVLFGRGTEYGRGSIGAKDFVAGLHIGDIVEIDNVILTPEGKRIYPMQCVSGKPKNIESGVKLDSEKDRRGFMVRHPRTAIGISADGNTIIMMVVDGRGASVGVTTGMLADLMLYVGASESLNLDGGGSSTLYTRPLGIRNRTSDGQERAVGNAIYAVVEGDVANREVVAISFEERRLEAKQGREYTPRIYAYNALGVLIDSDFKDYRLALPVELGTISEDGKSIILTGCGKGLLTATAGTAMAMLPVYVPY